MALRVAAQEKSPASITLRIATSISFGAIAAIPVDIVLSLIASTSHKDHQQPLLKLNTMGSIIVVNASNQTVSCFVSKYSNSGGDDSWFTLSPGQRDSWGRNGWELVAFKNAGDTNRGGVYTRVDTTVTFHDFNNITH
ncbi:hypothetical protein C8Q80DRAFT_1275982 [Daedaleopsis nitida]|nr:hypothetical protein C8Q80DRAFT_1275982 [Daedaleopsis nitida]